MQLTNWSFSKLMKYESCPMRVKLQYIDREPEPPQPADSPLARGNREHDRYERYVKGDPGALDNAEAKKVDAFRPALDALLDLYANNQATTEQDWFFDADWYPCEREGHWLWLKLDFSVSDEENKHAIIGDYKTGKSHYKVVEHMQQTQLYAASFALRAEWADRLTTELWYVDEGHIKSHTYTRDEALALVGRFQMRADRMLGDKYFKANPNRVTCKWCPYSPRGTGVCPVGV